MKSLFRPGLLVAILMALIKDLVPPTSNTVTPPSEPPILISRVDGVVTKSENGVLDVPQGAMLEVTCSVEGGSPPVSEIVIQLGEKQNNFAGTEGRMEELIESSQDGQEIQCSANRESGEYDKKTIVRINVTSSRVWTKLVPSGNAPILTAVINGESIQMINGEDLNLKPDDTLSVECKVPGDNSPISNTTIQFGEEIKTGAGAELKLTKRVVGASLHQRVVKCTAEVESGSYGLSTSFIIHVEGVESGRLFPIGIHLLLLWGPMVGLIMICAIVVALVSVCCPRQRKKA